MTPTSQEVEFNVLGCKVKLRPEQTDDHDAGNSRAVAVVNLVNAEIQNLRSARPNLKDTDLAVLVALKIATEKFQMEDEYKMNIFKLESTLEQVLQAIEG